MSTATSPSKFSRSIAAMTLASMTLISWLGFFPAGMTSAAAQSMPDAENGRYALSPVTDGVVRLDTRTGAVSTCSNSGAGWACYAVPDERAALDAEIGRLQADNEKSKTELEKLKSELAAREPAVTGKIDEALPKTDSLKKAEPKIAEGERHIEIPLPSDRDMDRVMSFLEQAWRRLVEMANRMQKDVSGKI
jgi:septal ring factor EnvC (AmiA/AmiB activator)